MNFLDKNFKMFFSINSENGGVKMKDLGNNVFLLQLFFEDQFCFIQLQVVVRDELRIRRVKVKSIRSTQQRNKISPMRFN